MENEAGFKDFAKSARNRFKKGFWSKEKELREREISKAKQEGKDAGNINELFKARYMQDFYYKNKKSGSYQSLYNKVKAIVDSECEVSNPIGRLIDVQVYKDLDENQKQRYILELAEMYRILSEKYKNEKQNSFL
jgi:hypothetical protein